MPDFQKLLLGKSFFLFFKNIGITLKNFLKRLSKREKLYFLVFLVIFIYSFFNLFLLIYFKITNVVPTQGGTFVEGILGQPRFLNPIYLGVSDADRDITELIFSGLFKYDENGNIVPDLAKDFQIKEHGTIFDITLKDNLYWQDNFPLTADDVIFTINLIQNPQYQSPLISKFAGIKVEKISDNKIEFTLKESYFGFLENLTVKIIPKHIFDNTPPEGFIGIGKDFSKIIGSGPFKIEKTNKDETGKITEISLIRNEKYYGKKTYLNKFIFVFFDNENDLIAAAKKKKISGFYISNPKLLKENGFLEDKKRAFKTIFILMPRYFALFFNLSDSQNILDKNIRKAISLSIDKEEIVNKVFQGLAKTMNSPFLCDYFNLQNPSQKEEFNLDLAKQILDKEGYIFDENKKERIKEEEIKNQEKIEKDLSFGFKGKEVEKLQNCLKNFPDIFPSGEITGYFGKNTKEAVISFQEKYADELLKPLGKEKGDGIVKGLTKEKLNQLCFPNKKTTETLEIEITTLDNFPLNQIANVLKEQLEKAGIKVNIEFINLGDLQTKILPEKNYQTILFGQAYNSILDPFSFWHSSQINYPGLNISGYNSKKADELLEKIRKTEDINQQKELLENLQEVILNDIPIIFLVQPNFIYLLENNIKGVKINKIIEPSKRFSNVENWYIKTKRVFK
ncbi:MAG: ABC transporter substrate-binding protein [Minisyncoccia bacterium]